MDELYTKAILTHHDFVRVMAFREAPYPGMTEDIVQQVFVEFLAKKEQWNYDDDLRPLLKTMTKHVAARLWREKSRKLSEFKRAIAEEVRRSVDQEESIYADEIPALHTCLSKLSGRARQLIEMRYFTDMSVEEIAEKMEMKPNSVYRKICRLRDLLRDCIKRFRHGGVANAPN